ncbi:ROK family transcriptional regulator [Salinactinospora qingdaonensis]|uniref:ROK family protein n=1 Tax=Salinactinospora qingdaonensis TaxID=702744 RepID=A0ABP7FAS1_9ACTN
MTVAAGTPAGQASLRRHNMALVLRRIAEAGPISRAGVASQVGLTKATVSSLVEDLLEAGLLAEQAPRAQQRAGRPGTDLVLNSRGPAAVGVEVNVDYMAACVVDLAGTVRVNRLERADGRAISAEETLLRAGRLAGACATAARRRGLRPAALTLAVPGIVAEGRVVNAPNLRWSDQPVAEALSAGLGRRPLPISVDNEANLAALAELWHGHGRELSGFLYVSGEIGIGAGLIVDGELFRGATGFAGELGHMCADAAGPRCACGARGCLECWAGQEALLAAAGLDTARGTRLGAEESPITELARRAEAADRAALAALERAGRALGTVLASAVNLLDPGAIVLGGSYADLAPWIAPPAQEELAGRVTAGRWRPEALRTSELGAGAAVHGAASAGVRALLSDPLAAM